MKTIKVVAAVIRHDNKIFATQRGYGEFKDGWEFPGGKIELGETPQEALAREIQEELETVIKVEEQITRIEYDYLAFHLSMDCFWRKLFREIWCCGNMRLPDGFQRKNCIVWNGFRQIRH